jgi:hypothetical protein
MDLPADWSARGRHAAEVDRDGQFITQETFGRRVSVIHAKPLAKRWNSIDGKRSIDLRKALDYEGNCFHSSRRLLPGYDGDESHVNAHLSYHAHFIGPTGKYVRAPDGRRFNSFGASIAM